MDNSLLNKQLEQLNLTPKEASVYIALLQLGQVGSSKIIEKTGLHGQFVYQALTSLESHGLVEHVIMRGRQKFSAKHPRVLLNLAEEKRRMAATLAEQLETMLVLPKQLTEVFQGNESYVAHEFDLLEQLAPLSEILVIGGEGDQFSKTMGSQLTTYEKLRVQKQITVRYLGSESQAQALAENKKARTFFDYKILPGLFSGAVNTNIYPTVVGFNIFGLPVTSFVVNNPVIAASQKLFFETLWKIGK